MSTPPLLGRNRGPGSTGTTTNHNETAPLAAAPECREIEQLRRQDRKSRCRTLTRVDVRAPKTETTNGYEPLRPENPGHSHTLSAPAGSGMPSRGRSKILTDGSEVRIIATSTSSTSRGRARSRREIEAARRQLQSRARQHMNDGRPRFDVDCQEREALAARFFDAILDGDVDELTQLPAAEVHMIGDGGGKAPAFTNGVTGVDNVAHVLASYFPPLAKIDATVEPRTVNGQPRAILRDRDRKIIGTMTIDVIGGRTHTIRAVLSPDKLAHLGPVADPWIVARESYRCAGPPLEARCAGSQCHRNLCRTKRVGRPKRQIDKGDHRTVTRASTPHSEHPGRRVRVSTWMDNGAPTSSSRPSTVTSGKPTSSSHMRVGSVTTGVLSLRSSRNLRLVDPRYASWIPPVRPHPARPRSIRKCH